MTSSLGVLARTAILSLGFTIVLPAVSSAQANGVAASAAAGGESAPASVPVFARELLNKAVWITADGTRVRGRVSSLSATSLVLSTDGGPATMAYSHIVKIEKSTHRMRKGALIGLAAGAGGMFLVMQGVCEGGCDDPESAAYAGLYTALGAGIGAGAGLGIGAILNQTNKNTDVLYDARRSTTTLAVTPIISPTRKGVAFSMSWR